MADCLPPLCYGVEFLIARFFNWSSTSFGSVHFEFFENCWVFNSM